MTKLRVKTVKTLIFNKHSVCGGGGFISIPVCSEVDVDVDGPGSCVSVGSGLDVLDDG